MAALIWDLRQAAQARPFHESSSGLLDTAVRTSDSSLGQDMGHAGSSGGLLGDGGEDDSGEWIVARTSGEWEQQLAANHQVGCAPAEA